MKKLTTILLVFLTAIFAFHISAQGLPEVSTAENPVWYYIENGHNSDASGGTVINDNDGRYAFYLTSKGESADVIHDALYASTNRDAQLWRIETAQPGTYYLINKAGGKLALNTAKGTADNTSRFIVSGSSTSEFRIATISSATYPDVSDIYCTVQESSFLGLKYIVALNNGYNFAVSNAVSPSTPGIKNATGVINNPRAWRFVTATEINDAYPYIETKAEYTDQWYYLKNVGENKYVGVVNGVPVLSDISAIDENNKGQYVFKVKASDYSPAKPGFFVNLVNGMGAYLGNGNAAATDWMLRHCFKPSERNEAANATGIHFNFRNNNENRNNQIVTSPFTCVDFNKNNDAYSSALAWVFEKTAYTPPPVTEVNFSLTNTTGINRINETVEVDVPNNVPFATIALFDADENNLPYQVLPSGNKIVFQATINAGQTVNYTLKEGTPATTTTKTYAAIMQPSSRADIAWENDRTAYRMYSRKLLTSQPATANGVDLWVKKKSEPVIEKMYTYADYHSEKEEGVDAYSVNGKTLGAGGIGAYANNTLYLHDPYDECEIVCNGPLRSEFVLTYKNVIIDGDSYTKTIRVTTDANGLLSKAVVRLDGKMKTMKLASGILLHTGTNGVQFKESNLIGYAENFSEGTVTSPNARFYIGVYMPGQTSTQVIDNQLVIMSDYAVGSEFTYYYGGGWNIFPQGEYNVDNDWFEALKKFKQIKQNLLTDDSSKLPSKAEIISTAVTVNNNWIAGHSDTGNNLWARATYNAGNIDFYKVYPDNKYLKYAKQWAEKHNWAISGGPSTKDADNHTAGQTYIDLYMLDGKTDDNMIKATKAALDYRINNNPTSDDWWWIDAMFMAMPTLVRLGHVYNDTKYYDKMYALFANIRDKLIVNSSHTSMWPQEYRDLYGTGPILTGFEDYDGLYSTTDHLWWRDWGFQPNVPGKKDPNNSWQTDVPTLSPDGKNIYWARGNGWVIAAMARTLQFLPENDAHRSEYIQMLQDMASTLKMCQREDGFWNMNLADPNHYPAPETSGTALFAYGLAWGINNGYLDKDTYYPVVAKAWNGLCKIAIQPSGNVMYTQNVGEGPIDPSRLTTSSVDFGVGAILMAASEVVKLADGEMPVVPEAPLSVSSVIAENTTTIKVTFDKEIDQATALNKNNYVITNGPAVSSVAANGETGVILTLSQALEYGRHRMNVSNVLGEDGTSLENATNILFVCTVPMDIYDASITVSASAFQTNPYNPPANAIDNDLDTRWAASGIGQWIKFDIGREVEVWAVDIAYYLGDQRIAYFDIELSSDDQSFTKVLTGGESSGMTNEMERYTFTSANARYVRLICNSNSAGGENWNSITEVRIRFKSTDGVNGQTKDNEILLYPNPVTEGFITIDLNKEYTGAVSVGIYDMNGKRCYSESVFPVNGKITINNLSLPVGNYILSLENEIVSSAKNFIVK